MSQCPTCGKQLDEGARFCPHDGTPLTVSASASPTLPRETQTKTGSQKMQLELPVVVGNRYRLLELRGGGGMARVYRAIDQTLEREVAVKLINPDLRNEPEFDARFQREARIASQLGDPHIVVVHDFGIDPTHGPYLVMEFLRGQSLRERLQTQGALPLKAALQLGAQMLLALIHAHEKGIVHRDIKPDNIFLLNQSGVRLHVRVLDFGIARIYKDDDPGQGEPLTQPGAVMGTPRYMSPEQLAGQPVDARSDLYSAAVVIWESLTGLLPYTSGKKLTEICLEATPALQELLESCLRPDPKLRPANAVEVYLRLQELGKASGILLLPPGAMERLLAARKAQQNDPTLPYQPAVPEKAWWRRRLVLAAVGVLLLVLTTWAVWGIISHLNKPAVTDHESLMGLEIGMSRDAAVAALKSTPSPAQFPWAERPPGLGHVLKKEDLGGSDTIQLLQWGAQQLWVVVEADQVRTVVTHARGATTARGLRIGDSVARLVELYPEVAQEEAFTSGPNDPAGSPAGTTGKLYRYDGLGIGFEVVHAKVSGITLYAARKGP